MAIISDKYKLLFIMNPRTGCTAVGQLMLEQMEGRYIPEADIKDDRGKIVYQKKHTTLPELKKLGLVDDEMLKNYTVFTTVRNPFDSLLSLWTKKRFKYASLRDDPNSFVNTLPGYREDMEFIENHSFAEWLEHFFEDKKSPTVNRKHAEGVDRVLRFETLQQDFQRLLDDCTQGERFVIPVVNETGNRDKNYQGAYDDTSRRFIEEKFAQDLREYDYAF